MDAIHDFAREGDVTNLLKCIENGVSVNLKGGLSSLCNILKYAVSCQQCFVFLVVKWTKLLINNLCSALRSSITVKWDNTNHINLNISSIAGQV